MYDVTYYIKEYHDHILLCTHEQTFTGACFDTIGIRSFGGGIKRVK